MAEGTVIDALALLAYLQNKEGADQVEDALEHGVLSAVTFTEVLGKLVGKGVPADQAEADLDELGLKVGEQSVYPRQGALEAGDQAAGSSSIRWSNRTRTATSTP